MGKDPQGLRCRIHLQEVVARVIGDVQQAVGAKPAAVGRAALRQVQKQLGRSRRSDAPQRVLAAEFDAVEVALAVHRRPLNP